MLYKSDSIYLIFKLLQDGPVFQAHPWSDQRGLPEDLPKHAIMKTMLSVITQWIWEREYLDKSAVNVYLWD